MACNWLPHRLEDVAQAIEQYLNGEEPFISAPDFPTGGLIINGDDVPAMIKKGRGSVKVRARYKIEKQSLVFYEIPYGCTTEALLTEVGKLCDDKEIEGIKAIRDESNRKGMRLVFECKAGVNPEGIAAKLFEKTNFQTTVSYNQVALVNKVPTELGLKDCIEIYVNHNDDCIFREAEFDKNKATARKHVVDGLLKALEDIDNIIKLIKQSENSKAAKAALMEKYGFSEVQAKAILDMKLSKLAHLEKIELEKEQAELVEKIKNLEALLFSKENRIEVLRSRLKALVTKYGSPRRTEVTHLATAKTTSKKEVVITPEDVMVVISRAGDIKKIPTKNVKVQRKTNQGIRTTYEATTLAAFATNTVDSIMLFSNSGKMYKIPVNVIPDGTGATRGVPISTLIKFPAEEQVVAAANVNNANPPTYAIFATANGIVKKTAFEEYSKIKRTTGTIATKIADGDSLVSVQLMNEEDLILITKMGMSIHFDSTSLSAIGRASTGVKGIKLNDGDSVVACVPMRGESKIGVFTENGYGKKVSAIDFPLQKRAGKGVHVYNPTETTGNIITALGINEKDKLMLLSKGNSICIDEKEVPALSKIAQGNIMSKLGILAVGKMIG